MDAKTHDQICTAYWDIWTRCQNDPEYARLLEEMKELEPLYLSVLTVLSRERRAVIDDYLAYRETMSRRMLEFACEEILFPKDHASRKAAGPPAGSSI